MSLLAAAAPIALLSPLAAAWPEDAGWLPLEMDHAPLEEPADDVVGLASEGAQDLVGDAENPSGYWAFDEDSFYFRMRVAASPEDASWAGAWGLVLDTDGSDVSFELALCVASNAASLVVRSPFAAESGLDTPLGPDRLSWDDPCALDVLRIASPTASSGALEDAWVDLALSRADLGSVGVTTRSALRVAMATSLDASCTAFDADGSGRDDTAGVGPVGEYLSDTVGIDTDLDDLDWYGELEAGSNPFLPDTDFDGLLDGVEVHTWGLDPTDADTDGDGLDDGDELQVYNTSPSNPDSDGDGLTDGEEVNVYGTNPNLNDTDQDGIRDGVEVACTLGGPDTDRDSDGISDLHEGDDDTDLDKSPDFCDTDSDGDGIPDADEGEEDVDCDGIPNYKDADDHDHSCGDTAPDSGTDDSGTEPDDTSSPAEDGDGAPCGCGPSGRPGAWIAGLIALGAVLSRRRASVARAAVLLWAVLVAMPDARAQGVDAQNLKPSVDGRAFVVLDDALAGRSGPGGGLLFSWADDPVVWRPETGGEEAVVSALGVIDALAFWNLGAFRVGLDVPFVPVASGDDVSGGHWIGDLSVDARSTILDRRSHRVGLSTSVRVSLPTGSEEAWVGDGTSTFRALVGTSTGRRLVVAANAGLATGAGSDALADPYGLDWGLRALWGAGVRVPLTRAAWVSGELFGESVLGNPDEPGAKPLEGLLSVRLAPHADLLITVGGGSGLSGGVGSPDLRAVAGISWVPTGRAPAGDQADADRDGDGIPDIDDRCPERPGVAAYQGCPAPGAGAGSGLLVVTAVNPGGAAVPAGLHILGPGGRRVPTEPDGVLEVSLPTGTYELVVSADGFASHRTTARIEPKGSTRVEVVLKPSRVRLEGERIVILDKVFFEINSAVIKHESLPLLDEVVLTLQDHDEILLLEIQGHTDDQGEDRYNLELSQRRAESVMAYLVRSGIAPERLVGRGYGETRPLQPGTTEEARAMNRRVEFHILKRR